MGLDVMAAQSGAMQTARLSQEVGMRTFKMGLDASKEQMQSLTDMLSETSSSVQRAAQPYLGSRLDLTA